MLDNTFVMKLSVEITGQSNSDIAQKLEKVLRLIRHEHWVGFESTETGSYQFSTEVHKISASA